MKNTWGRWAVASGSLRGRKRFCLTIRADSDSVTSAIKTTGSLGWGAEIDKAFAFVGA